MSDQDAGTTTPEAAETATEDTSNAPTGAQDAAETSSDDQDNGKGPKGGSDALKADLARERRLRQDERRQREAAQQELQKFKDRDLSELERAQKQAKEATERAERLERTTLQHQLAAKHNIPLDQAHRIQGVTADEMAADAVELSKIVTPKGPRPDPSQGSRAGQGPLSMNDLIRSAARRS